MKNVWRWSLIVLAVSTIVTAAQAGSCQKPTAIAFHRGGASAFLTGGVVRGESSCYTVGAKAGQMLRIAIGSPDRNVVVTIYQPGFSIIPAGGGDPAFHGQTLPGASDQDEATKLSVHLPATGKYLLVLGSTRGGGGEFHMQVGIR